MTEILFVFVSVFLLLFSAVFKPTDAQCPRGWFVEGIRPSGYFYCKPSPTGGAYSGGFEQLDDGSIQPPGYLHGRLYCPHGTQPIVVTYLRVDCEP